MPQIKVNELELFYTEQGSGEQTIVFGHGLLMDNTMWNWVAPQFTNKFRVICFDFRGQGQSQNPGFGFEIDRLVEDTAALIQALSSGPVHYVGLSMGGMVGMPLAARHPQLLHSLTLIDTSAQAEPWFNKIKYAVMTQIVKLFGVKPLIPSMLPLMFGKSFLKNSANERLINHWEQKLFSLSKTIIGPVSGVTQRRDISAELSKINCPTLIIVGEEDRTTPMHCAHHIKANMADAELKIISECGHSSALEKPEQVVDTMKNFYSKLDVA
jgi:3-oxoadipate enol-lactonase